MSNLTTANIPGMTVDQPSLDDITITYHDRSFRVQIGESDPSADEYAACWGGEITETTAGASVQWDSLEYEYDSATTVLGAAQIAIRQTVDDDEASR